MWTKEQARVIARIEERLDDLYQLVGKIAVHKADAKPAPNLPASADAHPEQRQWYDALPVKWLAVWAAGIITLVLATYGVIKADLLEGLWKFLVGACSQ